MEETTARKYVGQKGEQLMSKIKKIISNSLEDGVKPNVIYNSAKLSQYFNILIFYFLRNINVI